MHSNKRYSTINDITKYITPVRERVLFSLLSRSYSVFLYRSVECDLIIIKELDFNKCNFSKGI